MPFVPIAVVPAQRVETAAARAALPEEIAHADARFSVSRAALLGAGLASGAPELLAEAFADRLHEPYRGPLSPVYGPLRDELPAGWDRGLPAFPADAKGMATRVASGKVMNTLAASLPAFTSHTGLTPAQRAEAGIGEGMVRVSVGIEDVEDLWADLEHAITVAAGVKA